uniref:Phage terminase large subunit (GpA) n=2 Tax=unclassified Candidatus Kentrum TaxID=2643149 RepID=A0A451AVN5_9GAMM|nr:MAG: Phage terminase large subunit (GpA) [Candidatus Kentron sp. LPFa]VFK59804.1 MAG: Phage terminase large subunit (GpA) [Candidatus Kentron sp. UNK]VFK70103.1 MAG: Phage terminase large subunit (GpA) [Candidatus Kentron sp. UNK]
MPANAIADLKSTPAPLVIIEEPDDTSESVSDQGDAIRIVMERRKRQRRSKIILGGTPSVAGLSRVEEFIALSDKRVLPIRCHDWCCARQCPF